MIVTKNLGKKYKIYENKSDRLKEWLSFGKKVLHEDFWALKDINLNIPSGCVFGIIGMNGAGKSTLLKVLTGTCQPTEGIYSLRGRLASLLELGTGFHPELTGRENVLINGRLLGLTECEIKSRMGDIQKFCELSDFFDKPVRTYSSGMYVRLAFSLASSVDPDILIIDEALSVGDAYFQQKCLNRLHEFKEKGVTIIFVSHDPGTVKLLCDEVALLNQGRILSVGSPQDMVEMYNALLSKKDGLGKEYLIAREASNPQQNSLVYGNNKAEILSVSLKNQKSEKIGAVTAGDYVSLTVEIAFHFDITNPTIGMMIRDRLGYDVFGTNTAELYQKTGNFKKGQKIRFIFDFAMNIGPGDYTVTVAIHSSKTHLEECYQWVDRVLTFKILPREDYNFLGVALLKPQVEMTSI